MKRKLVLKKETLAELGSDDLRAIAAAYDITPACPTRYCASTDLQCMFSQYVDPCVTDFCVKTTG